MERYAKTFFKSLQIARRHGVPHAIAQVKITDFGLSKVMSEEEHEGGGMELTSQVGESESPR